MIQNDIKYQPTPVIKKFSLTAHAKRARAILSRTQVYLILEKAHPTHLSLSHPPSPSLTFSVASILPLIFSILLRRSLSPPLRDGSLPIYKRGLPATYLQQRCRLRKGAPRDGGARPPR